MNIPVILVSHGHLASSIHQAVELILGPQPHVAICELDPADSPTMSTARLTNALSGKREALILADLAGGTPANAAASFAFRDTRPVELVTGLNLPMLVAALTNHADTVSALAEQVHAAGQHGIDNPLRQLRAALSET